MREPNAIDRQMREAELLAQSNLVPDHYKGNSPNCLVAVQAADALGCSPVFFAQNTYLMSGKPAMTAKLMIAAANLSDRILGGIRWVIDGDNYRCEATERETNLILEGPVVNMAIAKAEGWTRNKKYQTIPDMMLRYRAASFFINTYLPDRMMGFQSLEEVEDVAAAGANKGLGTIEDQAASLPPELGGPRYDEQDPPAEPSVDNNYPGPSQY